MLQGDELDIGTCDKGNRSVTPVVNMAHLDRKAVLPWLELAADACRPVRFLVCRRNVLCRGGRAFPEEELFHLADNDFLILLPCRVQAVLVQQHLAEFHPLIPSLLRDVLVDPFTEFAIKGGLW